MCCCSLLNFKNIGKKKAKSQILTWVVGGPVRRWRREVVEFQGPIKTSQLQKPDCCKSGLANSGGIEGHGASICDYMCHMIYMRSGMVGLAVRGDVTANSQCDGFNGRSVEPQFLCNVCNDANFEAKEGFGPSARSGFRLSCYAPN